MPKEDEFFWNMISSSKVNIKFTFLIVFISLIHCHADPNDDKFTLDFFT